MEMLSYIFGSLKNSEDNLKRIKKVLQLQSGFNKRIAIFSTCMVTYIITNEIQMRVLETKIKQLNKEIKELKNSEGV